MKNKHLLFSLITFIFVIIFTSCSEDDPIISDPTTEVTDSIDVVKDSTNVVTDSTDVVTDSTDVVTDSVVTTEPKALDFISKIEVIVHQGHRHGTTFHANPQAEGNPVRSKQFFILEKDAEGNWKRQENNGKNYVNEGKSLIVIGQNPQADPKFAGKYAFEFIYYDNEGNRIDSKIFDESDMYQTLFSIESYTENATGTTTELNNTKELFSYTHRDTDPADQMIAHGNESGSSLIKNHLGLKGYAGILKSKISYTLNVNLVKFKNATDKNIESAYLEDAKSDTFEDNLTIQIPINVLAFRGWTDAEDKENFTIIAEHFGMTFEEYYNIVIEADTDPESSVYWM